jgi:hypothetical protein
MASLRPDQTIQSEGELRGFIPPPSSKVPLKKLRALDRHCHSFLELARLAATSTLRGDGRVDAALHGGGAGFVQTEGDRALVIPSGALPPRTLEHVRANPFAGSIFLIPGIDDTLRVNGPAAVVRDAAGSEAIRIEVEEAFLHCPKAFVRSNLWDADGWRVDPFAGGNGGDGSEAGAGDVAGVLSRSPFLFLATCRTDGHPDVSPRGDPPGFARWLEDRTLLVPDRPGNRLVDNFGNVLAHPSAALLFLVPGSQRIARLTGRATLVKDPQLLEPFTHQGKRALLGLALAVEELQAEESPALAAAAAWDPDERVDRSALPSSGRMILDHVMPGNVINPLAAKVADLAYAREIKKKLW